MSPAIHCVLRPYERGPPVFVAVVWIHVSTASLQSLDDGTASCKVKLVPALHEMVVPPSAKKARISSFGLEIVMVAEFAVTPVLVPAFVS